METTLWIFVLLLVAWLVVKLNSTLVYRFYSPGCGFCVSSEGEWNKFKNSTAFRFIKCVDINYGSMSAEERALAENFGVKGVPSIIKVEPSGKRDEYKGNRSAADIMKWVTSK